MFFSAFSASLQLVKPVTTYCENKLLICPPIYGIFNVNGSFYAVRNVCPHKNGPLCTGELSGRVTTDAPPSTPGATIAVDGLGEVLRCPWHQWAFDIATGRCLVDPEIRAKTYPVKIKDDDVVVEYED